MSPATPGLDSLLAPFSADEFLSKHWPYEPLHMHGEPDRFIELFGIPELENFRRLERAWPHEVFALPPGAADEYMGFPVQGAGVRRLFDLGMPMFLHKPEREITGLLPWLAQLRMELGVPAQADVLCSTHASPGGTSTNMHFDHATSFVLQISGTKKWQIAPNTTVPLPIDRHSLSMHRLHGKLANCQEGPLPSGMPEGAREYTLTPGSLLFVPTGWWHAAQGIDESLALMFIFKNVNWADVVCRALNNELVSDRGWRQLAIGGRTPSERFQQRAASELAPLLESLMKTVTGLTVDELLAPSYFPSPVVSCEVTSNKATFISRHWQSTIEFGTDELRLFQEIDRRLKPFTARDLSNSGFDAHQVEALVAALVDVEYLLMD